MARGGAARRICLAASTYSRNNLRIMKRPIAKAAFCFAVAIVALGLLCGCCRKSKTANRADNDIELIKNFYCQLAQLRSEEDSCMSGNAQDCMADVQAKEKKLLVKYCSPDVVFNALYNGEDFMGNAGCGLTLQAAKDMSVTKTAQVGEGCYEVAFGGKKVRLFLDTEKGKRKINSVGRQKYRMVFVNDTLRVDAPNGENALCRRSCTVIGVAVRGYEVIDSITLGKDYRVAILSPAASSDRVLLINRKGRKIAFDNVICNLDGYEGGLPNCERFVTSGDNLPFNEPWDFALGYSGGQGYGIAWNIAVKWEEGEPCVTGLVFYEHGSGLFYEKQIKNEYSPGTFPLREYERTMIDDLRNDKLP